MDKQHKRCSVCSRIAEPELEQCPECDSQEFTPVEITYSPFSYMVAIEREIDVLPGQDGYDKYLKWQTQVIDMTENWKVYFDEAATSVAKFEENGIAVTHGFMSISWHFPFSQSILSFKLVDFILHGENKEVFDTCDVSHYLNGEE